MANKKISELQTRTPSLTDLILVGDPSNGFSYKCTVSALATIIETDIADGYVTLGTTQTISGAKTFSNNLTLTSVANASTDTDKFLVLNGSNVVNYRTGSEVLSDIGGQGTITLTTTGTSGAATFAANTLNIPQYQGVITLTTTGTSGAATLVGNTLNIPNYAPDLSGYVPTSRTITINGTTQDLTANRTYNVGTVTSVAASGGTGISISGSPITSSGTITITNTAPDQVVALTAGTGISISGTYPNFTITNSSPSLGGTVTSVALSAPTGFAVTGSPITSSGTLALAFASGYSLPTTASQTNWDSAYNNMIVSAAVTGTTTKTLTLTQQDAGTITASWTDDNTDAVTSVFGRTGAVVAVSGDYNTSQVTESTNLYFTDARARGALSAGTGISYSTTTGVIASTITQYTDAMARAAISLTTTGSSGSATYSNTTGVLNIPTYTLAGLGGISLTSLSAFVPLIYNNTTGQFSITQSNSTNDGYLSATDWNTFNNKQATITLTTTGTSGAATLVGNTLNIPQYSGGGGTVSGTTNYIAKFTSSTAVGDSRFFDNGTVTFLGNGDVNATPSTGIFSGTGGTGTNIAGAELRIRGGASTGNASGGPITFYTSATGSVGTGVNAATERMRIDNAGNVGIGTSSPSSKFDLVSATNGNVFSITGLGGFLANFIVQGNGEQSMRFYNSASTGSIRTSIKFANRLDTDWNWIMYNDYTDNGANNFTLNNKTNGVAYHINTSNQIGLGTINVGSRLQVNGNCAIGYSASTAAPTNGLQVAGNSILVGTVFAGNAETSATPATGIISGTGGTGTNIAGAEFRIRGGASTGSGAGGPITFYTSAAGTAGTTTNAATERMRIDTRGNIGINVTTPSSWNTAIRAIELGSLGGTVITGNTSVGNSSIFGQNFYFDTGFKYAANGVASYYLQNGASHVWYYAASGVAGNAITFTEAMTLNASGNLGLGTATIGSRLQVNGGAAIGYSASTAAPTNGLSISGNTTIGTTTAAGKFTIDPDDNQVGLAITGTSLTSANAQSLIDLAQTWNTTGNPTAIKLNITNTASGTGADLMELQVGGVNQFLVTKAGNISLGGSITTDTPTGGTKKAWKLGSVVVTGSWVIDSSRYVEVEIDGTAYKLALAIAP